MKMKISGWRSGWSWGSVDEDENQWIKIRMKLRISRWRWKSVDEDEDQWMKSLLIVVLFQSDQFQSSSLDLVIRWRLQERETVTSSTYVITHHFDVVFHLNLMTSSSVIVLHVCSIHRPVTSSILKNARSICCHDNLASKMLLDFYISFIYKKRLVDWMVVMTSSETYNK